MKTTKLLVQGLILLARLCRAEVVIAFPTPDQSTSDLVEDLVNIVTSCYGDRIEGIGLAGDLPNTLLRRLSTQHLIPVAMIDKTTTLRHHKYWVPVKIRHKLPIFIVGVTSVLPFSLIIETGIKHSIWWNSMASFFILDGSLGCKLSEEYLLAAWESDLVNAKVMCYGVKSGRIIKNYNPYTSLAPVPWKKTQVVAGKNRHPFTVFVQESRGNEITCINLDFDKTKDLGGYQIGVEGRPPKPIGSATHKEYGRSEYAYRMTTEGVLDNVYRALNTTPLYPGNHSTMFYSDIKQNPIWTVWTWSTSITSYPHYCTGFVLISQFRGNKSRWQEILGVIDKNSLIGLGIAYLLTLLFFKFVVHQALEPAILNIVRITCGAGFKNIPNSNPPRIYLTGILFFAVTMHGTFEGTLISLLTTSIPLRNVNTMEDLLHFNYKLYGSDTKKHLIDDPKLQKNFIMIGNLDDCIRRVRGDESSACIDFGIGSPLDRAREFNLHVSDRFVTPAYVGYVIRWYWPLEERFNILLSRLVEADVLEPWDVKCNPTILEGVEMDQEVQKNKDFKNIELGDLAYAFVILGIGLLLATVAFILELESENRHRCVCRCIWRIKFQKR